MAQTSKIGSHATTVRKLKHGGLSVVYHNTEVVCYYPSHLAMPGELVLDLQTRTKI